MVSDTTTQQIIATLPLAGTGVTTYPTTNAYQIVPRLSGTPPLGPDAVSPGVGLTLNDIPGHSWLLTNAPNGAFQISNLVSGLFLDVAGTSRDQGAQIINWSSERWDQSAMAPESDR